MVKGAPKIVQRLSSDKRDVIGNRRSSNDAALDELRKHRVILGANFVGIRTPEGVESRLKLKDVLFGPFDF